MEDVNYTKNPIKAPELPFFLKEMVETSRKLSKNTYHLRVDFYETAETYYVGELTFYEACGFCSFRPDIWNKVLGEWIKLPIDNKE